jgi:UDP-2,3-diacylglucosamine pyrophosphatase LpxH
VTKTIVFSDTHFGYERFNTDQFTGFLNYIEGSNVDRIIILGDMLDLWRVDPVFCLSAAWTLLEKLRVMNRETHYVIGNHDYHIWSSCPEPKKERFLWLNTHYPYYVCDSTFMIHGDYFDIYNYRQVIPKESIYAIYEAIYYSYEPMVGALEQCFYDPVKLLMKWIELNKRKPKLAKKDPIAAYLKPFIDIEDKKEIRRMETGIRYLNNKPDIRFQLLIPAYSRPSLKGEMKALTKKPMSKSSRQALMAIDMSAPVRAQLFKSPLELAREISEDTGINNVIYGHTHKVENKASKGHYNVGSWVEGESTFAEIENGQVRTYRYKDGRTEEIVEKN